MHSNMIQDNYEENVVERESVLKKVHSSLNSTRGRRCILSLYGESGMGKSYVCRSIFYNRIVDSKNRTALLDFNQIENNNIPGILENIIIGLDPNFGYFLETRDQLTKYFCTKDPSKSEVLRNCVAVFIKELNGFAKEQDKPVLLIFDTYEALPIDIRNKEFLRIIEEAQSNICFIISGIERVEFAQCDNIRVDGFDEKEIRSFFVKRNPETKAIFKKEGNLLASNIRYFTNDGHPILCGLLSDYIRRCKDINNQLKYLLGEDKEKSYQYLVNSIKDLPPNLFSSLRITAYFNYRMTSELLSDISGMAIDTCRLCLQEMIGFSFVKRFSNADDKEIQIVLHNVIAELLKKYFPYTNEELDEFADRTILSYDKMIAHDKQNYDVFKNEKALRVERVLSMVRNGSFPKALALFDSELISGLDEFDYSFIKQLIAEIETFWAENRDPLWEFIINASKAECYLNQYCTIDAINIFNDLKSNQLYTKKLFQAIADGVFGLSLVNPSSVDRKEKPIDAICVLDNCILIFEENGLKSREAKTRYWLGIAYARTGQNDLAYLSFEEAKKRSTSDIQRVNILLEMSKILRLQQDVKNSLIPLRECDIIMEKISKNKGKYYYYKANSYRDLGEPETADFYYKQAFEALDAGIDDFTLCELYFDYAWFEYLRFDEINMEKLNNYLEAGWKLARKNNFGTEFSEYYHILYEIEHSKGKYEQAYCDLGSALKYAYMYSNIYMILDCLNHKVQMQYQKKEYEAISKTIEEMEKIEKTGCKIRVFRGRAKLVLADTYFNGGRYLEALTEYFNGFLIVALYGNSYTNVELFNDLFFREGENGEISRNIKIKKCLTNLPNSSSCIKQFKKRWVKEKVSPEYNYFIDNMNID